MSHLAMAGAARDGSKPVGLRCADSEDREWAAVQMNPSGADASKPVIHRPSSSLRLANLVNLTLAAIFVTDTEGVIQYWTRGAGEFYGWTQKEAIGKRSDEYLRSVFLKPVEGIRGEIVQHQRQHRIAVALAAALLANLLVARIQAQSQPPQYVTTVWQTEQGLPQNSVNAMVQDHRGYLWIGTFGGWRALMACASRFSIRRIRQVSAAIRFSLGTKAAPECCGSVRWAALSSGWMMMLPSPTPSATACRAERQTAEPQEARNED